MATSTDTILQSIASYLVFKAPLVETRLLWGFFIPGIQENGPVSVLCHLSSKRRPEETGRRTAVNTRMRTMPIR